MNKIQSSISDLNKAISISAKESKSVEDNLSAEETIDIEFHKDELLSERINDIIHYRELRKEYAYKVFMFMCIWCVLTFSILIIKGSLHKFDLSETVLVTLTGGTTVSVIGLVGFIIQGLFNSNNHYRTK